MTQYTKEVEDQKIMYEAVKWSKSVETFHSHSLNSMAYALGRQDGAVRDTTYHDGTIKREIRKTGQIFWFGKKKTGPALIEAYKNSKTK